MLHAHRNADIGVNGVGAFGGGFAPGARFDAILSDIDMPGMDGLDFVRALRGGGAWRDLPVIALAGAADPDAVQAAREAGFTDFVAKFERGALLGSLRQCLDQKTEA